MKLALLARLLPSEASEFSCLSVVEEGIRHLFNNVFRSVMLVLFGKVAGYNTSNLKMTGVFFQCST